MGTDETIRVAQFNVLAHGLADFGGGFGTLYRDDAPSKVQNMAEEITLSSDLLKAQKQKWNMLREEGRADETMSSAEKKWLHSKAYREILFGRSWGPRPYGVPERIKRVAGAILAQCPDVITLQELDHYAYVSQLLDSLGYSGEIHKKIMDPTCRGNGGRDPKLGYGDDGVAIFWNTKRLEKVKSEHIIPKFGEDSEKESGQRIVILTLKHKQSNKEFVVVTGHFKSGDDQKPKVLKMKKYHVDVLTEKLKEYAGKPIIFTCDFNTSVSSKTFEYFQDLNKTLTSAYDLSDTERLSTVKKRKGGDQPNKVGKEKNHTIDFIFYSQAWKCVGTLGIPHKDHVLKETNGLGMPCWRYPSDHFMLCADLVMS